jgi:hypothetical protein
MGSKQGKAKASVAVERFITRLDSSRDDRALEVPLSELLEEGSHRIADDLDAGWDLSDVCLSDVDAAGSGTPDPNAPEEWGEAFGIHYAASEPLRCGEKERDRDAHRWELDPASADDYRDRVTLRIPLLPRRRR